MRSRVAGPDDGVQIGISRLDPEPHPRYTRQHRHYCGVDLHARTMYLCILSHDGEILLEQNLRCDPKLFLRTIEPYREDLVIWSWLADLCARESIPFVLGQVPRT